MTSIWKSVKGLMLGLVLSGAALAQTAVLAPSPKLQLSDGNGHPLAAGLVYTCSAGAACPGTPLSTFKDSTGGSANTNPIVLDGSGMASVFLTPSVAYKFVVQTAFGVLVYTQDNVTMPGPANVGGANTQVQYNCNIAFCGNSGFTFNAGTQTLSVTSIVVTGGGSMSGTFGGNPIFSGGSSSSFFKSTCANAAAAGAIRLCPTDQVNWRNVALNADQGIGTVADALNVTTANGMNLVGATLPMLRLGGTTASFPGLLPNGTELDVKLADNSGFGNFKAAELIGSTAVTIGAVRVHGVASSGQVPVANSASDATWQSAPVNPALLSSVNQTLGANIPVSTGTNQAVLQRTITMPSSGCPCRVLAAYGVFMSSTNSVDVGAKMDDGVSDFATAITHGTGSSALFGAMASAVTINTYANNAAVVFTLRADPLNNGMTILASNGIFGQNTWCNLSVIASQ